MTTPIEGDVKAGFEPVAEAFAEAFEGKPLMGAALAVRHHGEPVVDLWGGLADERDASPWRADTASVIFSCTKGLTAILAARLVQEGLLDYDAPVAHYWPEFAQAGKEGVLVRHVLSHRSGLSAPRVDLTAADLVDWEAMTTALAQQAPLWEPGTGYAYHAITQGWLIGEVIRRVTGTWIGAVFADRIADPLAADAWIGLPPEQRDRVAHLKVGPTMFELTAQLERDRPAGIDWNERAMTLGGALPRELATEGVVGFNDPEVQAAEIPAAGGIATARALATIWSAVIETTDGVRLLDDATLALALEEQSAGSPVFETPPPWSRWGVGFQLDSEARRYLTPRGFGHDGAGGQVAFADPGAGVGFGFVTNQMEAIDVRGTRIVDALREVIARD